MGSSHKKASELRKILELISAMNRVYELREQHSEDSLMTPSSSVLISSNSLH